MGARATTVTATDVALLRYLAQEGSIVAASRRAGISRDRATYRLARLKAAFGGPPVVSVKGGRDHGRSRLTPLGDRIVRQGFDAVELLEARPVGPLSRPNLIRGIYRAGPPTRVAVGDEPLDFRVAFSATDGEPVRIVLDPESILIARRQFASSARNVLRGSVTKVHRDRSGPGRTVAVKVGPVELRVAVTEEPLRELGIRPGARVWLYVKATALRRVSGPEQAPR